MYQQLPVIPESDPVSRYVEQLGAHLVSHAPGLKWPFTFHVVASQDINAFALPGGSIFVNLGTVQAAQTEAQLAGVLAHEASHVVLRHSTCNMKKQQTNTIVAGVGSIASRILLGDGTAGQIGQAVIGAGNGLYGLRMSRDNENRLISWALTSCTTPGTIPVVFRSSSRSSRRSTAQVARNSLPTTQTPATAHSMSMRRSQRFLSVQIRPLLPQLSPACTVPRSRNEPLPHSRSKRGLGRTRTMRRVRPNTEARANTR